MKTATVKVPDDVRAVLARATVHGFVLKLPEELERDLYVKTDKVLKAAGGKWNRGRGGHVFAADPRPALGLALAGALVDEKKTRQAFFTPEPAARQVARHLIDCMGGQVRKVLEPSAGEGALALALRALAPEIDVTCVEIDPGACAKLHALGFYVTEIDFLKCSAYATTARTTATGGLKGVLGIFDAVLMNPPFTGGQDIEHVLHAWPFVKPGGVLVAIVAPSWKTRQGAKWERFRALQEQHGDDEFELPAGTFAESGTNVTTHVIVWRRP